MFVPGNGAIYTLAMLLADSMILSVCSQYCSVLSTILFSIVTHDSGSTNFFISIISLVYNSFQVF